ncbi:ABC transporter ATP-binding protein [Burkholderia sp. Bp8989]|nr:ABC transporter ATP-binding protein [Burkholderia sp. Bp8995]RQS42882.1 ABC transporter ATP-binding protein [Burkholderia sp. Bp8989]
MENDMSILRVAGLGKRYAGRTIFSDVELELQAGVYALRGKNGSGKSTLLKLLAGVVRPDAGVVEVGGHAIDRAADKAKACTGYMPDSEEFYDFVTPSSVWRLIADARGTNLEQGLVTADRLGLTRYADEPLGALSQGTRRKVFLVGAFMGPPALILLDEPSNALDAAAHAQLCRMIAAAAPTSVVLMSTHDAELVAATRARILELTAHGIVPSRPSNVAMHVEQ